MVNLHLSDWFTEHWILILKNNYAYDWFHNLSNFQIGVLLFYSNYN